MSVCPVCVYCPKMKLATASLKYGRDNVDYILPVELLHCKPPLQWKQHNDINTSINLSILYWIYKAQRSDWDHTDSRRLSWRSFPEIATFVKLQNLSWYKTGSVSRQVLHLLWRLQNWICPKTGQYKTCIVSNTKIEACTRATKPKHWQSHLTPETVEKFIQNEKAGLGSAQSRFWCGRFSVGAKPVL